MGERVLNQLSPPPPVTQTKRKRSNKLLKFIGKLFLWTLLGFTLLQFWFFAHILWWKIQPPGSTAFMRERAEENPNLSIRYNWVPYHSQSSYLKRALIASEDAHFLEHKGFDWDGIRLAYERNKKRGYIAAGGSTITQQLAKNLFLSGHKSFIRKGQEAIITLMIEYTWSKSEILETYLNVIEWGDGIFGAEAASRHYFKTSAANLSSYQAARLAAMVPSPRYFQKQFNSNYMTRRTHVIRARLQDISIP
jgi:monofunctional biosynthetic peptidoglycan transglycosylase